MKCQLLLPWLLEPRSTRQVQSLVARQSRLQSVHRHGDINHNVLYKQVNRESLTAEARQRLVERADADKLKKAVEQLKQLEGSSPEAFPDLSKYFLLLLPASVFLNKVGGDPQPSGVETGLLLESSTFLFTFASLTCFYMCHH